MALTKSQISQLYVAIFNRASEGAGNTYWQTQAGSGAEIADLMLATGAAKSYFGDGLDSNQAFIEHIYNNTLNKTLVDDPDGIRFWVGALNGGYSRGEVVASLVAAIDSYAHSTDPLAKAAHDRFVNRVEISDYMADVVKQTPSDFALSTAFNAGLLVTEVNGSVDNAKQQISQMDGYVALPPYLVEDVSVAEKAGSATLTVVRTGSAAEAATVAYTTLSYTAGPTDFSSESNSLTFLPGETEKVINIDIANDSIPEIDEHFRVIFSHQSGEVFDDFRAEITIIDDDHIVDPDIDTTNGLFAEARDPAPVVEGDQGAGSADVVVDVRAQTSVVSINQGPITYQEDSIVVSVNSDSSGGADLALLTIDSVAGTVTYNPDDFDFLEQGEQLMFDVDYRVAGEGSAVEDLTLMIAIVGDNEGYFTVDHDPTLEVNEYDGSVSSSGSYTSSDSALSNYLYISGGVPGLSYTAYAERLESDLDPAMWIYEGHVTDDNFPDNFNEQHSAFIAFADDTVDHVGPWGDPRATIIMPDSGEITIIITNYASGPNDGGDELFDYQLSLTNNGLVMGTAAGDVVTGADGNEAIVGLAGNDTLIGGAGSDAFIFGVESGIDSITDFIAGSDTDDVIYLYGIEGIDDFGDVIARATDIGANTQIILGSGDSLTILGVSSSALHADDFIFG